MEGTVERPVTLPFGPVLSHLETMDDDGDQTDITKILMDTAVKRLREIVAAVDAQMGKITVELGTDERLPWVLQPILGIVVQPRS